MLVSFYSNTKDLSGSVMSSLDICYGIKNGLWKDAVNEAFMARSKGKESYAEAKKALPAACWSGVFKKRQDNQIESYSGLIVLDIDKLSLPQINTLMGDLSSDTFVYTAFVSPSGEGVKIVYMTSITDPIDYLAGFLHLQDYFQKKYILPVDPSGKNISRLCYVSFDPNAIINENPEAFQVDKAYGVVNKVYTPPTMLQDNGNEKSVDRIFNLCKSWIESENKFMYVEGQRNRYIHALCCAMNRCGVSKEATLAIICTNYDLPQKEMETTCNSAYFHNHREHGSVQVKELEGGSVKKFVAPPYVQNYTDDVVTNDIMTITATLHHHGVPKDMIVSVVGKVAKLYKNEGFLDIDRKKLSELMNEAVNMLKNKIVEQVDQHSMEYKNATEILKSIIVRGNSGSKKAVSSIHVINSVFGGGFNPGDFYGLIGVGGTFKSFIAIDACIQSALNGVPSLYLNGEMSDIQYYRRLAKMVMNVDIDRMINTGELNESNMDDFIKKLDSYTNNNLFYTNNKPFTEEGIISTIESINLKHGKEIGLLVVDGLTQMDWGRDDEIKAAIRNSAVCKEVAKNANNGSGTAVIALVHTSGGATKHTRDTSVYVRGGVKVTANMDGYICTSLIIDEGGINLDNPEDMVYREGMVYTRMVDKRNGGGSASCVSFLGNDLKFLTSNKPVSEFEVNIKNNNRRF